MILNSIIKKAVMEHSKKELDNEIAYLWHDTKPLTYKQNLCVGEDPHVYRYHYSPILGRVSYPAQWFN